MEKKRVFELIDGFMAWDGGATDSGIYDQVARKELKEYLTGMDPMERTLLLFEYIRDFASEEMAQKGYNVESIV